MSRFILLLCLLLLSFSTTRGQCVISKNSYGQIITTCELYSAEAPNRLATATHKQIHYLGSEYFAYPAWQKGTVQLDPSGKELACLVAYNVVENKVLCQFANDLTATPVKPYAFTINGTKFTKQLGQAYVTALNEGQTRLVKSFTSKLVPKSFGNGYEKGSLFDGYYQTQEHYYIQKGDGNPQPTSLSKGSLLSILHQQADQLMSKMPTKQLTSDEVIKLLTYYDSLTIVSDVNKPLLSRDVVFSDFLHDQLKYPGKAWNIGVYGRVYTGFEVSKNGQLINITLLSPDNVGFDLGQTVRQALSKLATVKPEYVGNYVLPVSFTYTNTQEKETTHVPLNKLAPERFEGRSVLQEIVVPIIVSKPVNESREVWGYYN